MTVVSPDTDSNGSQAAEMSGSDLLVMVPWLVFAAGLAIVYIRLHGTRRRAGTHEDDAQEAEWPERKTDTRR